MRRVSKDCGGIALSRFQRADVPTIVKCNGASMVRGKRAAELVGKEQCPDEKLPQDRATRKSHDKIAGAVIYRI
jgi:hypothetical protein